MPARREENAYPSIARACLAVRPSAPAETPESRHNWRSWVLRQDDLLAIQPHASSLGLAPETAVAPSSRMCLKSQLRPLLIVAAPCQALGIHRDKESRDHRERSMLEFSHAQGSTRLRH